MSRPQVRAVRIAAFVAAAVALPWRAAGAQDRSTPYIALGTPLDQLTRWAIGQGALPQLDPQVRPFRLAALEHALREADTTSMTPSARRTVAWLRAMVAAGRDSSVLVAEIAARGYTSGRRDTFRPGGRSGAAPAGGLRGSLRRGAFSATINPLIDNRLKDDPEFTGYTARAITGRMADAYVAVDGAAGDIALGRLAQSWGPDRFDGLLVSDVAYPVEAVNAALRLDRVELRTIVQRLNDWDTTVAASVTRWRIAHRLGVDLGRGWHVGLTETGIYGGPGRGFDPALSFPLGFALLAQYNEHREVNVMVGADLSAPLGRGVRVEASGFLDDIQLDRATLTDRRPTSYGVTTVVRWASPTAPLAVSAGYTRVASLAYRNSIAPWYGYTLSGVGLGRNFADYDQVLVRGEWRSSPRWSAMLEVSYLRQGSGGIGQPFPSDSVLARPGQGFLVAPVTRAPGVRLNVAGTVGTGVDVVGEIGATRLASGATKGIALIGVRMRADLLRGRLGGVAAALPYGSVRPWP